VYHNSLRTWSFFDYQPGRGGKGPSELLKDFGVICRQTVCGLQHLQYAEGGNLIAFMAHARRKFIGSRLNDEARSGYALAQIQ